MSAGAVTGHTVTNHFTTAAVVRVNGAGFLMQSAQSKRQCAIRALRVAVANAVGILPLHNKITGACCFKPEMISTGALPARITALKRFSGDPNIGLSKRRLQRSAFESPCRELLNANCRVFQDIIVFDKIIVVNLLPNMAKLAQTPTGRGSKS